MARIVRTFSKNKELVEKRRAHIINCAASVFIKKGFRATNLRDIGEACKMSKGALYHYIGTKDDILYLIIEHMISFDKEQAEKLEKNISSLSATEAIRDYINSKIRLVNDSQHIYIFLSNEMRELPKDDQHIMLGVAIENIKRLETVLNKGIQMGEFKIGNPALVAHNLVILCNAWAIRRWFLRKQVRSVDEYIAEVTEFILRAICKDTSSNKGNRSF